MFSSYYYKGEARYILPGNNLPAMIGTFIYSLPIYVLFLLQRNITFIFSGPLLSWLTLIIEAAFALLVSNILDVGYIRFLSNIKPKQENEKTFNFNHIISGYTSNFKNTFKVMFLKNLYLLGWGLFAAIPFFILMGIISYLAAKTDIISTLYSYSSQLMLSPSPDMINNISTYISENCSYLPAVTMACILITIPMCIPLVRKHYEYYMIPMILADDPDISAKKAFKLTSDIMIDHRMRFFFLQLSFIGYYIIMTVFSFAIIPLLLMFYLVPYTNLAYIRFYRQRLENVEYNGRVSESAENIAE